MARPLLLACINDLPEKFISLTLHFANNTAVYRFTTSNHDEEQIQLGLQRAGRRKQSSSGTCNLKQNEARSTDKGHIYSHARWSYRRRFGSLLLCPLSVERYYFPSFVDSSGTRSSIPGRCTTSQQPRKRKPAILPTTTFGNR